MYVLLIPAISQKVSDSIYCLNTDHIDNTIPSQTQVSKGQTVCTITYRHLPKMGFGGFLRDALFSPPKHTIELKSPVSGTFERGQHSGSFHKVSKRDFDKPFKISSIRDELDNFVAFRFYTAERLALSAGAFYQDFFTLFERQANWADEGMRDSSYYDPDWRENLQREKNFFANTICPVLPAENYKAG